VRIRALEKGDVDAVIDLVTTTLASFGFSANVGGLRDDLEHASERYRAPHAGFWVADREGAIVGTCAIRPKEGATCELKRLYVRADARGGGVGQSLYEHAERFARAAGYERIWLDSSRRFTAARRLYERNGFVLLEELDNDWEDNAYEKRL